MKILAQFFSHLFHPIFIPAYAIYFLVFTCAPALLQDSTEVLPLFLNVLINAVFFPLITVILLRALNFIKSIDVAERSERIMVYIPTMMFLFWAYQVLNKEFHPIFGDVMLGAFLALAVAFVAIAIEDKISAHTIGMGGLFAIVLIATRYATVDLSVYLFLTIFIAGAVGTSRLILEAHTHREVYKGYLVGFLCMALALIF